MALFTYTIGDSLNSKKPRCPKDHHMSNSVYMLMYKRVDTLGGVVVQLITVM